MTSSQILPDGAKAPDLHETILSQSIQSTENVTNIIMGNTWSQLPIDLRNELLEVIIKTSIPNKEFFDTLDITLELAIDSKFQGDDWECSNCQKRKLDFQRNCPYLDKEEHEDSFSLDINGETYRVCPMNLKDPELLQKAFEAKSLRESTGLPEDGSIGEQSAFYVICSQKVINKIETHKNKQMAEATK